MAGTEREFIPTFERILRERGNHPALCLLQNFEPGIAPDERGPSLTYTELGTRAHRMAAGLAASGLRGERVLSLHPTGLEFTVAMLGCIYSGAIAVPAPPPTAFGRAWRDWPGSSRTPGSPAWSRTPRLPIRCAPGSPTPVWTNGCGA